MTLPVVTNFFGRSFGLSSDLTECNSASHFAAVVAQIGLSFVVRAFQLLAFAALVVPATSLSTIQSACLHLQHSLPFPDCHSVRQKNGNVSWNTCMLAKGNTTNRI